MKPELGKSIVNSPGLWMILFAGFGLLCLQLGEKKINNKIRKAGYSVESLSTESQKNNNSIVGSDRMQQGKSNSGKSDSGNPDPSSKLIMPYQLTILEWILGSIVVVGIAWLVVTIKATINDMKKSQ